MLTELNDEGMTTVGSRGQMVLNPKQRVLQDIEQKLVALEDRLGLSPESRLRLGISAVEHKSKLEAFIEKGRR